MICALSLNLGKKKSNLQGNASEQLITQYCQKVLGITVHYYSASGPYALPSKDQRQMLLWVHWSSCEQEDLSWSDQLWWQTWRHCKQVGVSWKRATRVRCFGDYEQVLEGLVYLVKKRWNLIGSKSSNVLIFSHSSCWLREGQLAFPGEKPFLVTWRPKKCFYTSFNKQVFVGIVPRCVLHTAERCHALCWKAGRQLAGGGRSVLFLAKPLGCLVTTGDPLLASVLNMCVSFLSVSRFECSKNPILSKPVKGVSA